MSKCSYGVKSNFDAIFSFTDVYRVQPVAGRVIGVSTATDVHMRMEVPAKRMT